MNNQIINRSKGATIITKCRKIYENQSKKGKIIHDKLSNICEHYIDSYKYKDIIVENIHNHHGIQIGKIIKNAGGIGANISNYYIVHEISESFKNSDEQQFYDAVIAIDININENIYCCMAFIKNYNGSCETCHMNSTYETRLYIENTWNEIFNEITTQEYNRISQCIKI